MRCPECNTGWIEEDFSVCPICVPATVKECLAAVDDSISKMETKKEPREFVIDSSGCAQLVEKPLGDPNSPMTFQEIARTHIPTLSKLHPHVPQLEHDSDGKLSFFDGTPKIKKRQRKLRLTVDVQFNPSRDGVNCGHCFHVDWRVSTEKTNPVCCLFGNVPLMMVTNDQQQWSIARAKQCLDSVDSSD